MDEEAEKQEKKFRQLNATTKDIVETIVIDWINKYYLEDSNLAIKNFDDSAQVRAWVTGVWGRISHQLSESGLKYDNSSVLAHAGKVFYEQIGHLAAYEKLRPHLPTLVTKHEPVKKKDPKSGDAGI